MRLCVENLAGGYGETQVLFGVSLDVAEGEVVSLLGRNGMGKTTTVRTLMGLLPRRGGTIRLDGRDLGGDDQRPGHSSLASSSRRLKRWDPKCTATASCSTCASLHGSRRSRSPTPATPPSETTR